MLRTYTIESGQRPTEEQLKEVEEAKKYSIEQSEKISAAGIHQVRLLILKISIIQIFCRADALFVL